MLFKINKIMKIGVFNVIIKFHETSSFIDIVLFVNIGKTLLKRKLKAGKKSYFIKKKNSIS